jgi:phi13 family phage major tail protein
MARIKGANNFHLAPITTNTETTYIAGTPVKTERLVSIEVEDKVDSDTVYSDDEVEEDVYGAVQKTGKVKLNYLSNETKLELFGGQIDADGVYYPPGEFEVKHHAMGFVAPTTGIGNKYVWYYDVVFELPSFKAETAEDKPKIQEVELSFKCYKNKKLKTHFADLDMNSLTANATVAQNWFNSVRVSPSTATTVLLADGSLGAAGDKTITGLIEAKSYRVTFNNITKYTNATGALVDLSDKAALGTGVTAITGLTNGVTYYVELIP